MKKLLLAFAVLATVSSCSVSKQANTWVSQHCTHEKVGEFDLTKCENLYPTEKVQDVCGQAVVCFDITGAKVELKTNCGDTPTLIVKGKKLLNKLLALLVSGK